MATTSTKPKREKSISSGRPPNAGKPPATLSKKTTNTIVNSHHQLTKQLATAEAKGNEKQADELKKRISDLGGLKAYQLASIQGQADDRGGDSSIQLLQWLTSCKPTLASAEPKLRMLEVGALSTKNACSKSGLFDITRIDLFSQSEGIIEQDFMERPIPKFANEQFDIVSLSLVLNFVPHAGDRGEMLKRTCQFLDQRAPRTLLDKLKDTFPALFMVMPAACTTHSRYLTEERLTLMMASLGYVSLQRKQTAKLVYSLWQLRDKPAPDEQKFGKKEVRPGGGRNNFSIVLRE